MKTAFSFNQSKHTIKTIIITAISSMITLSACTPSYYYDAKIVSTQGLYDENAYPRVISVSLSEAYLDSIHKLIPEHLPDAINIRLECIADQVFADGMRYSLAGVYPASKAINSRQQAMPINVRPRELGPDGSVGSFSYSYAAFMQLVKPGSTLTCQTEVVKSMFDPFLYSHPMPLRLKRPDLSHEE